MQLSPIGNSQNGEFAVPHAAKQGCLSAVETKLQNNSHGFHHGCNFYWLSASSISAGNESVTIRQLSERRICRAPRAPSTDACQRSKLSCYARMHKVSHTKPLHDATAQMADEARTRQPRRPQLFAASAAVFLEDNIV